MSDEQSESISRYRETSVQAFYNAVDTGKIQTRREQVWDAIKSLGKATALEVHRYLRHTHSFAGDSHSITPRFAELRDLGVIRESDQRECQVTGEWCIVWEIVPSTEHVGLAVYHRCELCGQLTGRSRRKLTPAQKLEKLKKQTATLQAKLTNNEKEKETDQT